MIKEDRFAKMLRSLRDKPRQNYCKPIVERVKRSESRNETAVIIVSTNSSRQNNRNLVINQHLFAPNGIPTNGNVYFKCLKEKCKVRATISKADLEKGGECIVGIRNHHNHQPRFRLHLGRESIEEDLNDDKFDSESESRFISSESANRDENNNDVESNLEASKVLERETIDMETIEAESVVKECDADLAKSGISISSADTSRRRYLEEMLDVRILTKQEKMHFEAAAQDLSYPEDDGMIYKQLKVIEDSKFGRGVTCNIDIEENQFIGSYYGRLCRRLPRKAFYSFNISQKGLKKKLFVDAESELDRPLLG